MKANDMQKMREALKKIADLTEPCEGVTSCEVEVNMVAKDALVVSDADCEAFLRKYYNRWNLECLMREWRTQNKRYMSKAKFKDDTPLREAK